MPIEYTKTDQKTTSLTKSYAIALTLIAILSIAAYILNNVTLKKQASDALLINIAGRQRMLSQQIVKEIFILPYLKSEEKRNEHHQILSQSMTTWTRYEHNGDAHKTPAQLAAPIIPPPQEELVALYKMSRLGDIMGIRETITRLKTSDAQLAPFIEKLHKSAEGFQIAEIRQFIKHYLKEEQ